MRLYGIWGIEPKYHYLGQTVTKKQFKQQALLSSQEVKLFDSEVSKVKIDYGLTPQVINIKPYKDNKYMFEGVMYLTVELKEKKFVKKMATIIHQSIPQPTFLIFKVEEEFCLSSAIKRLNMYHDHSIIIEECHVTKWFNLNHLSEIDNKFIESLSLQQLPHHDFYEFYQAIQAKLYNFNHVDEIGEYQTNYTVKNQEVIKQRVELIKEKQNQLNQVISKIKKETQFNKKLELNEQAIKLQKEIDELKST